MTEELKIKVTADIQDFKKGMEQAQESLEETTEQGEEAQTAFQRMAKTMEQISPSFKAASDKWRESSEKLGASFGKNSKMAKGFKLAGLAAIGGVVAKILVEVAQAVAEAAKKVWQFAKDTAKMYDPRGYSKAAGAAEKSVTRLKTAVGSFTAPIVNALYTVFSKIVDGITWVVEKLRVGVAVITGVFKAVIQPIVEGIRSAISWLKNAINSLAAFLGIGKIFKESSKNAKEAADSMEDVVDATSAGLAGFDKLTTLDFSGMGDAEEAEKISDSISEAEEKGKKLVENLNGFFKKFDFGGVWDRFRTGSISAFSGAGDRLKSLFSGMASDIGTTWTDFSEYASNAISGAIGTIGEIGSTLGEKLGGAWNTFSTKAGEVFGGLWGSVSGSWELISEKIVGVWGSFKTSAAETFGGLWSGIESGWNTVKKNILGVWDGFKTSVVSVFSNMWSWVCSSWTTVRNNILGVWDGFRSAASGAFSGLWSWVSGGWNTVRNNILGVWDGFKSSASSAFSGLWSWVSSGWSTVSSRILGVWDNFKSSASSIFSGLWETVKESWNTVRNNILGVWDSFKDLASWAFDEVKKILAKGIDLVFNIFKGDDSGSGSGNGGGGVIIPAGSGFWSDVTNAWNTLKGLFGLAGGGAIAPNNPMPYILGDNKKEYEVVSPVSLMEQTVMSAIKKAGVGSGANSSQPVEITIQLDGKKVARAIYDPLETERRRRGARA